MPPKTFPRFPTTIVRMGQTLSKLIDECAAELVADPEAYLPVKLDPEPRRDVASKVYTEPALHDKVKLYAESKRYTEHRLHTASGRYAKAEIDPGSGADSDEEEEDSIEADLDSESEYVSDSEDDAESEAVVESEDGTGSEIGSAWESETESEPEIRRNIQLPVSSPISRLPPEIRNQIHRLVLIEEERIEVQENGVPEPGLLKTCCGIRAEAKGIFYLENKFDVQINDFDCRKCILVLNKMMHFGGGRIDCGKNVFYQPNWPNVARWLYHYHRYDVLRPYVFQDYMGHGPGSSIKEKLASEILEAMFEIVDAMLRRPWKEVRKALSPLHRSLQSADEKWEYERERLWVGVTTQSGSG